MKKYLYTAARRMLYKLRAWREYFRPIGPGVFKHIAPEDIVIRQVCETDIKLLDNFLPSKHFSKHRERFQAQTEGKVEYLIAWYGLPIGYILVVWNPTDAEPLKRLGQLEDGTSYLEDLYVHPAARGKGVGKLLWDAGDQRLREKGFTSVLGTVMLTNPEMEGTHRRRGYRLFDDKIYDYETTYTDKDGMPHTWSTKVKYFIRDL
jgi:GNAT superfamily N-acetyltransferase